MEVSQARLEQDQARDELTKARVTIHSFQTDLVEQDIQAGLKITAMTHAEEKPHWSSATADEWGWDSPWVRSSSFSWASVCTFARSKPRRGRQKSVQE